MTDSTKNELEVGDYFFGLPCTHCGNIVRGPGEPTKTKLNLTFASHGGPGSAGFSVKCSHCGKNFTQPAEAMRQYKLIAEGQVEEA